MLGLHGQSGPANWDEAMKDAGLLGILPTFTLLILETLAERMMNFGCTDFAISCKFALQDTLDMLRAAASRPTECSLNRNAGPMSARSREGGFPRAGSTCFKQHEKKPLSLSHVRDWYGIFIISLYTMHYSEYSSRNILIFYQIRCGTSGHRCSPGCLGHLCISLPCGPHPARSCAG